LQQRAAARKAAETVLHMTLCCVLVFTQY